MHFSVREFPPTEDQLKEETTDASALLRLVPQLRRKIAFRSYGTFPSPIHVGSVTSPMSGIRRHFLVKREDLCGFEDGHYGGNKVRTLQHQLASIEAGHARGDIKDVVVCGSAGSNQIVATAAFMSLTAKRKRDDGKKEGQQQHISSSSPPSLSALWFTKDPSDLDNAINMMSALSFESLSPEGSATWAEKFKLLKRLMSALLLRSGRTAFIGPGGNCPSGVLGQISAMLELVEQQLGGANDHEKEVSKRRRKTIRAIYLPIGSSCTISGLIVGAVLARRLLGARKYDSVFDSTFEIVGTPIHHAIAFAQRNVNFLKSDTFAFCPLTIQHTVRSVVALLSRLLGTNHRIVRGLEADALDFLRTRVRLETAKDVVGTYGGHSEISKKFADAYDRTGNMYPSRSSSAAAPALWLCGHFAAKAFSTMIADLDRFEESGGHDDSSEVLFWQTKSRVQPAGHFDEFERARRNLPRSVREWMRRSHSKSSKRTGTIDIDSGTPETYRHLFTRQSAL
eukprot:g558.t1